VTLTSAGGPLGSNPLGRFSAPVPDGVSYIEPHARRVVAQLDGRTVIDTEGALMVHRRSQPPTYAFPLSAVGDLPNEPEVDAPGYVRVPWDAVDTWFEEGRRLVHYPPNPYHRVDYRSTRRRLTVEVGGTTLVDTDDTTVIFETSLAPKLYVARHHVRMDLLQPSSTSTYCNYKGESNYWSAVVDGQVFEDVAWSYEDPLPESTPIHSMLSFEPTVAAVVAELPGDPDAVAACSTECDLPDGAAT